MSSNHQNRPFERLLLLVLVLVLVALAGFLLFRQYKSQIDHWLAKKKTERDLRVGPPFVYPPDRADKVQILNLLKARKFQELTTLLEGYQKDFERDYRTEYTVFDAFDAFSTDGPLIEPYLNEWVSQMPQSFCPYLARGCHYKGRGWASRGGEYAYETSDEQFAGMESYFSKALKDFDAALKINPNLLNAYANSGDISSAMGTAKSPEQWFREAEKRMPYSVLLRTFYMGRLMPRWGGSREEMEAFADECDRLAPHNSNLKVLRGYIHYDKASLLCSDKQNAAAVKEFTRALEYGEFYLYLEYRGGCLGALGKHEEALSDLDRALKLRPQRLEILTFRAEELVDLKRFQEAREMYNLVASMDPEYQRFLSSRNWAVRRMDYLAYEHVKKKRLQEGLRILNEAQQLEPANFEPYYYRANVHYLQHDLAAALTDVDKAVELNPHEFRPRTLKNYYLAEQAQWDQIIQDMDAYLAIEPKSGGAYFDRARAKELKKDVEGAAADFARACELGHKDACKKVQTSSNH